MHRRTGLETRYPSFSTFRSVMPRLASNPGTLTRCVPPFMMASGRRSCDATKTCCVRTASVEYLLTNPW